MGSANAIKTGRARRLRHNSTDAELRLWHRLRSRSIDGHKFVRQEPIGPYVVDFICRERRLIIEVDGGQHADNEQDRLRGRWLVEHNYRVMRFWNNEVLGNTSGVLEAIMAALRAETPPHPPAFGGRPLPASGER
jgi:very-short-patch-repair endonuclease